MNHNFMYMDMQEDDIIIEMVGKQGNKKWSAIAQRLLGRIGKQCRERYFIYLITFTFFKLCIYLESKRNPN